MMIHNTRPRKQGSIATITTTTAPIYHYLTIILIIIISHNVVHAFIYPQQSSPMIRHYSTVTALTAKKRNTNKKKEQQRTEEESEEDSNNNNNNNNNKQVKPVAFLALETLKDQVMNAFVNEERNAERAAKRAERSAKRATMSASKTLVTLKQQVMEKHAQLQSQSSNDDNDDDDNDNDDDDNNNNADDTNSFASKWSSLPPSIYSTNPEELAKGAQNLENLYASLQDPQEQELADTTILAARYMALVEMLQSRESQFTSKVREFEHWASRLQTQQHDTQGRLHQALDYIQHLELQLGETQMAKDTFETMMHDTNQALCDSTAHVNILQHNEVMLTEDVRDARNELLQVKSQLVAVTNQLVAVTKAARNNNNNNNNNNYVRPTSSANFDDSEIQKELQMAMETIARLEEDTSKLSNLQIKRNKDAEEE